MSRFVVIEGRPADALEEVVAEVRAGARVVRGWTRRAAGPGVLCAGAVENAEDAAAALLCALAGARLVIHACAAREVADRLLDDLRRLGPVDHRVGTPQPGPLTPEERRLLGLLLGGATLGQAAQHLHISRRTADRRLAAARAALGARTTPEALSAAARAGLRPESLD